MPSWRCMFSSKRACSVVSSSSRWLFWRLFLPFAAMRLHLSELDDVGEGRSPRANADRRFVRPDGGVGNASAAVDGRDVPAHAILPEEALTSSDHVSEIDCPTSTFAQRSLNRSSRSQIRSITGSDSA